MYLHKNTTNGFWCIVSSFQHVLCLLVLNSVHATLFEHFEWKVNAITCEHRHKMCLIEAGQDVPQSEHVI